MPMLHRIEQAALPGRPPAAVQIWPACCRRPACQGCRSFVLSVLPLPLQTPCRSLPCWGAAHIPPLSCRILRPQVRISGRIPGARLHTWEGWGHGFKDSERLAQVVTDFLLEG